jgi:hypothetical protein
MVPKILLVFTLKRREVLEPVVMSLILRILRLSQSGVREDQIKDQPRTLPLTRSIKTMVI